MWCAADSCASKVHPSILMCSQLKSLLRLIGEEQSNNEEQCKDRIRRTKHTFDLMTKAEQLSELSDFDKAITLKQLTGH
jgi:hypothetical protein